MVNIFKSLEVCREMALVNRKTYTPIRRSLRVSCISIESFQGEFVNNMFQGFGKYTWPDGSIYEGNFSENKLEGHSKFTDVDNQVWFGNFTHHAAPGLKFKLNL
ncbi:hypothetical protein QZH41_019981 [Actinostola sp. cb2023]|nr:hypothetical protein QZH41_019981 [Actinostola sp. cb2023]